MTERERTYDEGEEQSDEEELCCIHCDEPLEEGEECGCRYCDECGEEFNQWDRCPNRCHLSEAEKRSEDLDTIGCQEYHSQREDPDWDDD